MNLKNDYRQAIDSIEEKIREMLGTVTTINKEEALKEYKSCESLLNLFFREVDYCNQDRCNQFREINKEKFNGCCNGNHCDNDGYIDERIALFGYKERTPGHYCRYHTEQGCGLTELKPAVCIAYTCIDYNSYLRNEFGINYTTGEIRRFFDSLLNPKAKKPTRLEIKQFKRKIQSYITIVKAKKIEQR